MSRTLAAIASLLLATAILYTGNGLQTTLLALRGSLEGFSDPVVGALASAYFVGFIAGCRYNPGVIKSAGHIRAFVSFASVASASALAHAVVVDPIVWAVLRCVTGFCFAGIAMVLESWINARASNASRGQVLSLYRIVDLSALTIGNALLATASPAGFHLFAVVSILISIALVPVALTRASAPEPGGAARLDIAKLFAVSPVAVIGAAASGLGNAAFWGMGPVYAQSLGYAPGEIGLFVSAVIVGGATSQWPLGWMSDRVDRRIVLLGSTFFGALAAYAVGRFGPSGQTALLATAFLFGVCIIPTFGISAAHANDHADPSEAVSTNGGLLLLHGLGSAIGAFAGGAVMAAFAPSALFLYIGGVYAGVSVICALRILTAPAVSSEDKSPFSPIAKNAAPTVFEIQDGEAVDEGAVQPAEDIDAA
ncbi:MAG: MFS transporter [Pseudomonadota bacterium]